MFTIYIEENYNISFNSNKSKFCLLIYYTKIILILYLIDACVLIDILIAKSKILSTILYYIYNISMLSLYIVDSFLNRFIFVNNKS